jgi:hypothetical protein
MEFNYHDSSTLINLLPTASYSAGTTVTGTGIDMSLFVGKVKIILNAAAGGTGTADVKLTECDTVGGSYTDVSGGAFTQVTTGASLQSIGINKSACKQFIKASVTVGTGPQVLSVVGVGAKNSA